VRMDTHLCAMAASPSCTHACGIEVMLCVRTCRDTMLFVVPVVVVGVVVVTTQVFVGSPDAQCP
jgi:hypothetical protein